jgi:hypothetical protein
MYGKYKSISTYSKGVPKMQQVNKYAIAILFATVVFPFNWASAEIITFDDLNNTTYDVNNTTNDYQIPNGYHGYYWNNFYVLNSTTLPLPFQPSGYQTGMVSTPNVAVNAWGNQASLVAQHRSPLTMPPSLGLGMTACRCKLQQVVYMVIIIKILQSIPTGPQISSSIGAASIP